MLVRHWGNRRFGTGSTIGALLLASLGIWLAISRPIDSSATLAASRFVTAFVEAPDEFGPGVRYWNRSALGNTYVLADGRLMHALAERASAGDDGPRRVWTVIERAGVAVGGSLVAEQPLDEAITLISPQSREGIDLGAFARISIPNAWEGVDVAYQNTRDGIERIYTVHPHASPARILISLDGVLGIRLASGGDLAVATGVGELRYRRPFAFQLDAQGERATVAVKYRVGDDGKSFGFDVGSYDPMRPLVIDPLLQATYFGGGGNDNVRAMAADTLSSDILVAGFWESGPVPEVVGGFQESPQVQTAVIARFDRNLERLEQMTFFGGPMNEDVTALAVDPVSGDVFLTGTTNSVALPGSGMGIEPAIAVSQTDGFIARFSGDLRSLEQMTFFGGQRGSGRPNGIAIDATHREVYVTGGGLGQGGAVLVRYDATLTTELSRTSLEGNVSAEGFGVAINPTTHDVYMLGETGSRVFPRLAGGAVTDPGASGPFVRMFVARFDRTLATHFQSTYVANGNMGSYGAAPIVIHPGGDVFVAAEAEGDVGAFPGAAREQFAGNNRDAFVARFSADLTTRRAATYFGGDDDTYGYSLGLSADGNQLYLAGYTFSRELSGTNIVTSGGSQSYVARLDPNLTSIGSVMRFSSSNGNALVVHPASGEIYLTGAITFPTLPETRGGAQPDFVLCPCPSGSYESYVARFDPMLSHAVDTTPEAFAFAAQSGVAPASIVISAPVRIYGVTEDVPVSVQNGEYSIDGEAFTGAASTVSRGQWVRVRHTSANAAGAGVQSVLTVGGVDATFASTTASGMDVTPDAFSFGAIAPVARSRIVQSNRITVEGISAPASVSVTGGEYSIDDAPFRTSAATVNAGQSIVLRQQASADLATQSTTTLTVGTRSAAFTTTTDPIDTTPHAFRFKPKVGVPENADWDSDLVVVTGFNSPAPLSIVGGTVRVWDEDGLHLNPSTVRNLSEVVVTVHTGGPGTTSSATLTIGGVSATFAATVSAPLSPNATPNPFSFPSVSGAETFVWVESQPVTLSGFSIPAPIQFVAAENTVAIAYFVPEWNAFAGGGPNSELGAATFAPGHPLRVRLMPQSYGFPASATIEVGGQRATFTVNTRSNDATPNAFNFVDHTGVAPGSTVATETLTIAGMDSPAALTTAGCSASIGGRIPFVTQGTVVDGDTVSLQIVAPAGSGASATCTVTIGGVSDTITVTTSGTGPTPPVGGGGSSGGGGGGKLEWLTLLLLAGLARTRLLRGVPGRKRRPCRVHVPFPRI